MPATAHFSIKYDGPALAEHRMDVRELAPALMGLAALIEDANRIAFPESDEVRVHVQGNFKGGSFGVDLIALQGIAQQLVSLLTGPSASAASNLFGILSGLGLLGGGGVLGLIVWLRGRKPSRVTLEGDRAIYIVTTDMVEERFEVDLVANKLYSSRSIRRSFAQVVRPLERDGIDRLLVGRDADSMNEVAREEDVSSFLSAAEEADVVSNVIRERTLLQIDSAVFKDGNKWRFSDGANAFYAQVSDPVFMERINLGVERFGKGDVLIVDLRQIQTVSEAGLKSEYEVLRVWEHRGPLQAAAF